MSVVEPDPQDRRGPRTRAAIERAERDGSLARGRALSTTARRFEARWDRIVFAAFSLVFALFMLGVVVTRAWTGWSTLFLFVALAYAVVGGWLLPRGALRADLAMAGEFLFDQKTDTERRAYARGTLRQLLWTVAQLAVFVGGMALLAVTSAKVA